MTSFVRNSFKSELIVLKRQSVVGMALAPLFARVLAIEGLGVLCMRRRV